MGATVIPRPRAAPGVILDQYAKMRYGQKVSLAAAAAAATGKVHFLSRAVPLHVFPTPSILDTV